MTLALRDGACARARSRGSRNLIPSQSASHQESRHTTNQTAAAQAISQFRAMGTRHQINFYTTHTHKVDTRALTVLFLPVINCSHWMF